MLSQSTLNKFIRGTNTPILSVLICLGLGFFVHRKTTFNALLQTTRVNFWEISYPKL